MLLLAVMLRTAVADPEILVGRVDGVRPVEPTADREIVPAKTVLSRDTDARD